MKGPFTAVIKETFDQKLADGNSIHGTVRYRIARLRELLGDALETPEGRFQLGLALRVAARL